MNLAFFGSSPLAIPLLEKLNHDFSVKLVVTSVDRPIGRKQILKPSPLKTWAIKNNISPITPISLKSPNDEELVKRMEQLNINLSIVIDFGLLIPKTIFDLPKLKTINIHFSLLPKYRGPYPDAFVILNNEKTTGISYVLINKGYDTGDILAQEQVTVKPNETAGSLHERLYQNVANDISYIIRSWAGYTLSNNSEQKTDNSKQLKLFLPPKKQDHKLANYTKKLSREDGYISWNELQKDDNHREKYLKYRAFSPWPGMWTLIKLKVKSEKLKVEERRLKILKAHLEKEIFILDEVQLEGKKPVAWNQFQTVYKF